MYGMFLARTISRDSRELVVRADTSAGTFDEIARRSSITHVLVRQSVASRLYNYFVLWCSAEGRERGGRLIQMYSIIFCVAL